MCDYSLQGVISRPARVGDALVTMKFAGSYTRGFADAQEPSVAVCLPPGTELAFEREMELERSFFFFRRKQPYKVARFRQIDMDKPHQHHDALEFPDGKVVLVTLLCGGQRATVLQLPSVRQGAQNAPQQAPERKLGGRLSGPPSLRSFRWPASSKSQVVRVAQSGVKSETEVTT